MKIKSKAIIKITSLTLAVIIMASAIIPAIASNPGLCEGVTEEMCYSDYWRDYTLGNPDAVLMTKEDIEKVNKSAVDSAGTYVMGIETMAETYNANSQRQKMQFPVPTKTLYINGEKIDKEAYYAKINAAILETGYTETEKATGYAICVKCTDMKYIPTLDRIGYSADDTDDEMEYESINVNEPFIIRGECTIDSVKYYYGYTLDCPGWVPADDFAICESKAEWLDAWKFDLDSKDFLLITEDVMTLEPNLIDDYSSKLEMRLSTALKLVPDDEIPESIGGRNSWNNYVVYVPTKNDEGMYEAKAALISQHHSVNIGYLPFTQSNAVKIAFTCLGDAYGWGGMLNLYDCSLYTRTIYRCFGIVFPRNGTWQQKVEGTKIDLSGMTDEEKQAVVETLPTGSALFITGHTMMYLGTVDSVGYVISDLGTAVAPSGSTDVLDIFSVAITPLTIRRGSSYKYTNWLHNLTSAVMVMPKTEIGLADISATLEADDSVNVSVSCNGKELTEGLHYSKSVDGTTVTINGINTFSGDKTLEAVKESEHQHSYTVTAEAAATCLTSGSKTYTCECGDCYTEEIDALGHKTADKDGKCPVCGEKVADSELEKVQSVTITVPDSNFVNWKYRAILTTSSDALPEGYHVAWFEGETLVEDGDVLTTDPLTSGHKYTAKIVDSDGIVVSKESQNKSVVVLVKDGFFDKIISFLTRLFGNDIIRF